MVGSTNGSEQTISIFTFSWNSATIVLPRYCSTTSRSPPWPVTRLNVMPVTPARNNAALTSGSRSGRMMVVIRRIVHLLVPENRLEESRSVSCTAAHAAARRLRRRVLKDAINAIHGVSRQRRARTSGRENTKRPLPSGERALALRASIPERGTASSRGLLLCEAVQRAESPHQIDGVNADDGMIGEYLSQNAEGDAVLRIVECGNEDRGVRDIEVRVAGGESPAVEQHGRGHRQVDDLESTADFGQHVLEALTVFFQRRVVRVLRIVLPAQHHAVGADEAA